MSETELGPESGAPGSRSSARAPFPRDPAPPPHQPVCLKPASHRTLCLLPARMPLSPRLEEAAPVVMLRPHPEPSAPKGQMPPPGLQGNRPATDLSRMRRKVCPCVMGGHRCCLPCQSHVGPPGREMVRNDLCRRGVQRRPGPEWGEESPGGGRGAPEGKRPEGSVLSFPQVGPLAYDWLPGYHCAAQAQDDPWKWLWTIPWGGSQTAFHILAQTLEPSAQTVSWLGVVKVIPQRACQHRVQAPPDLACLGWGLSICVSGKFPGGAAGPHLVLWLGTYI